MSHLEPRDGSPNTSPRSSLAPRRSSAPRATPPRRRRVISTSAARRRTIIPRQEVLVPSGPPVPPAAPEPPTFDPPAPPLFEISSDFKDAPQNIFCAAGSLLGLLSEIVLTGLGLLKKPLIYLFYFYLFVVVLCYAFQFAAQSLYRLLSPICVMPGASLLNMPICDFAGTGTDSGNGGNRIPQTDFPRLINLQSSFEDILENSAGGNSMALDLKNSEVAVRDLSMLVRVSKLVNRDELSERLDDFVQTAKQASRGLTRFGSRVNGVVDNLLAMDEFAIRSLENAQLSSTTTDPPSVASAVSMIILAPLHLIASRNPPKTESSILRTFLQASATMDTSIQRLILEAELVLRDLDDLENRLSTIQGMASREDSVIQEKHQEVLAELWSFLGGNRRKLANFASHRSLLANIATYRSRALAHVSASLIRLQQMQSDLEDLRDRVAQPVMLRDAQGEGEAAGEIPLEIPLEVHVESIRKGIERLNRGRERIKGGEHDYVRKVLSQHDEAIKVLDARR